ncbi:MAG: glycoside hydrolase superfamily [Benjaminiella poitrasii]|nr:MAG: glycoside hydrolase superfamily [Benjaminiella poitrasii]
MKILVKGVVSVLCLLNAVIAAASSRHIQRRVTSSDNKVFVGYFPNWLYDSFPPSRINFTLYTHIYYAFALQVQGNTPVWADDGVFDDDVEYNFQTLVKLAKAAGTKVMHSVGGWTGGTQFSPMVASASARAEFIKWNTDFISKYDTAGVDLDWEYPTAAGPGCNVYAPDDVANYLKLIKELRVALDTLFPDKHKEITLAVHIMPWGGDEEVDDVSEFVPYVDRFNVMTFDVNGAWNSISGPNSPFRVEAGKGFNKGFVEGIDAWNAAGVPYDKLVGGLAFYGRAQTLKVTTNPTTQYNPAVSPNPPLGDSDDGPWTNPYCPSDSAPASGEWKFSSLLSEGLLSSPTTAVAPWIRHFDNITQTPWLYNPINKQYISYDDPVSIGVKAQYAANRGLGGLFVWSADQDSGILAYEAYNELMRSAVPTLSVPSSTSTRSSTTSASSSSPVGTCAGVAVYIDSAIYVGGDRVTYQDGLYSARWWTQGEAPRSTADEWAVWQYLGSC